MTPHGVMDGFWGVARKAKQAGSRVVEQHQVFFGVWASSLLNQCLGFDSAGEPFILVIGDKKAQVGACMNFLSFSV